jgi:hypothetical protein
MITIWAPGSCPSLPPQDRFYLDTKFQMRRCNGSLAVDIKRKNGRRFCAAVVLFHIPQTRCIFCRGSSPHKPSDPVLNDASISSSVKFASPPYWYNRL